MKLTDFDYHLPPELIAQYPAVPRDSARLLNCSNHTHQHQHIFDLPDILKEGDILVVNNTKVIPALLTGKRGEGQAKFTLLKRLGSDTWSAFAKPAKKCPIGTVVTFENNLQCQIIDTEEGGGVTIQFSASGTALDAEILAQGAMPLPPYIKRPDGPSEDDEATYQTLFARHSGAVAAPTAGLHFTDELRARLDAKGVAIAEVTLHVGAGTFLPVKVDNIKDHNMHSEWGALDETTAKMLNDARADGRRIICVGTTSLRILETIWQEFGQFQAFSGETDIFITPGFSIGSADMLLTNFHLPKSTLLMLVSAFSGYEFMKQTYEIAVADKYRFFSYGDACLLERERS
ncbi:MAG: tRNA preQ1(34) S-adenosylmethionine ribosyltransferase-isomerase QueA [Candidatus Puniceispirillaceae bacterium]